MTTSNYVLFFKRHLGNAEHGKRKNPGVIFFIVMLVNFCFQVVLGRLFREYLLGFDIVFKG